MKKVGRIFSLEEITERKIPKLESFTQVIQKLGKELATNKRVDAALLYGSALWRDFSIRSDLDCLVIYNDSAIFSDLKELITSAKKLFVPLEIVAIDQEMAKIGISSFGQGSFIHHLKRATKEGGVIKGDPFSVLRIRESDRGEILKRTIAIILTKLHKALCELSRFNGEKRIILLGKILSAPMNIVRTAVWAKGISIPDESKKEVLRAYLGVADETSRSLLTSILRIDEEYSEMLERILKQHNPDLYKEEYAEMLRKIEEIGQNDILEFIRHNARLISRKL